MKSKPKSKLKRSRSIRRRMSTTRQKSPKRRMSRARKSSKLTKRRHAKRDGVKKTDSDVDIYTLFTRNLIERKFNENLDLIDFLIKDNDFDRDDKIRIFNGFIPVLKSYRMSIPLEELKKILAKLASALSSTKIFHPSPIAFEKREFQILKEFEGALKNRKYMINHKIVDYVNGNMNLEQKRYIFSELNKMLIRYTCMYDRRDETTFNELYSLIKHILDTRILDPNKDKDHLLFTDLISDINYQKLEQKDFITPTWELYFHQTELLIRLLTSYGFQLSTDDIIKLEELKRGVTFRKGKL